MDRLFDGVTVDRLGMRRPLEHLRPSLQQLPAMREAEVLLVALGRASRLEMADDRAGLVEHEVPPLGDPEAEVDILVVGGEVALVETAQLVESLATDKEVQRAAVLDTPAKSQGDSVTGQVPTYSGARAVLPDDRAGLLQCAVGEQDAAADRTHSRGLD